MGSSFSRITSTPSSSSSPPSPPSSTPSSPSTPSPSSLTPSSSSSSSSSPSTSFLSSLFSSSFSSLKSFKINFCIYQNNKNQSFVYQVIFKETNKEYIMKIIPVSRKKIRRTKSNQIQPKEQEEEEQQQQEESNDQQQQQQQQLVDNVIRELTILKEGKNHPFISKLKSAFYENKNCYFVLDCYLGGDLRYHINLIQDLSEKQVANIISCIGTALNYLHKKNIIHRDVKPENILLDANGTPYLCDFGISIIGTPGKLAICKSTSGTLPYLAPEVLTESHCHSYESDFWGLGLTAYELRFKSQLFPHVPRSFVDYLNRVYLHIWSILESTIENPDFDPSTFNFQEFANNLLVSDENLKTLSSQEFYNSMDFDLPIIDDGQISQCFKAFIYEILDLRPHMRLGNLNEFEIRFKNHQFFQNYGINFDQLSTIFSERNNNEEHGDNDAYYPYFDRIQEKLIHKNLRESITDYLTLRSNIPIQLEQKLRNNFIYSPEHHE